MESLQLRNREVMLWNNRTYFLVFSFLLSLYGWSQDLKADMSVITEKMKASETLLLEVEAKMYNTKGGAMIFQSSAEMMKDGTKMKSKLGEMEFLITDDYEIRIDNEEKSMLILDKSKERKSILPQSKSDLKKFEDDIKEIEKLFSENENKVSIALLSSSGGIKKYSITGIEGIKEVVINLDLNKKSIKSISYEYGSASEKGQYVVVVYSRFEYDATLGSEFNLSGIFTKNQDNYILQGKYKNYHLFTEL